MGLGAGAGAALQLQASSGRTGTERGGCACYQLYRWCAYVAEAGWGGCPQQWIYIMVQAM